MKINNPKSMLDFTRDSSSNNIAQNLVTVGQLYTIANKLTARFDNKLIGVAGAGGGGMTNNVTGNGGGYGYAWLDANGKLDTSLLPAIAISETHVISESELVEFNSAKANELGLPVCQHYNSDRAEYLLHNYLSYHTKPTSVAANSKNLNVQKGDMIVVHPGNVTLEPKSNVDQFELSKNREIPDEFYNSTDNGADINVPNVRFSGSYMITEIDKDASNGEIKFYFVKISYTDGNIVKINDCVPKNSAGEVEITLTDILKYTAQIQNVNIDRTNPAKLTEAVTRLSFGTDSDRGRFYFIDNSNDNVSYVPYTKLSEHNDLSGQVYSISSTLSSIINTYKEEHNADVESLTQQLSDTSGLISSTFRADFNDVYGKIGDRTAAASWSIDDGIFPQIKGLRSDISENLTLLNNTRCDTNDYLALIRDNVMALHNGLNKHAVQMLSIPVTWSAPVLTGDVVELENAKYDKETGFAVTVSDIIRYEDNIINVAATENTNLNAIEYLNVSDYSKAKTGGIGYRRWTLHYNPTVLASWSDNENPNERILAVFDNSDVNSTGEQIFPDISYSIVNNSVVTHISIDVEVTDTTDCNLVGTAWTLYVAKTIGGIKNTFIDSNTKQIINFNVGGISQAHEAHYNDTIVGNHTGSDQTTNN